MTFRRRQAAVSIPVGGVRAVLPALPCDGGERSIRSHPSTTCRAFPGQPIEFSDDGSWRMAPGDDAAHANLGSAHASASRRGNPIPHSCRRSRRSPACRSADVADTAVGDVRSRGRAGRGRAVHQLQPVHVVPRRIERAVRADDVPAVASGAARHRRRRERLAVRRMAVVADGAGRARSDLLRAAGERARVPGLVAAVARRADDARTDQRLPELSRRHGPAAARRRHRTAQGDFKLDSCSSPTGATPTSSTAHWRATASVARCAIASFPTSRRPASRPSSTS